MKILPLLSIALLFGNFAQSQALSASITVEQECFCRVQSFQSANCALSCAISGGSGNHYVNWTRPDGNIYTNSFVVGPEPGMYVLEVFDTITSGYFIDSIYMDSINPIADFTVVSNDLIDLGNKEYKGYNSVAVIFENNSTGFAQSSNPNSDTLFQWTFDNNAMASWFFTYDMNSTNNTYGVGIYEAALVAKNFNDCRDTTSAMISIYATSADISSVGADEFKVIPNSNANYIDIIQGSIANTIVKIFDMKGQLMLENELIDSENLISFDYPKGIYVYQIIKNSEVVFSDKFQF